MTVSSRSEGSRLLGGGSLLVAMALASGALAQGGSEAARLAGEARQAFLAAEGGASAQRKIAHYQVVRARLTLLEKFAGQDAGGSGGLRDEARSELARLAGEGLDHDAIGAVLLQSSVGDLLGSQAAGDRIDAGVSLHLLASGQKSPAHRAAAFITLANAYGKAGAGERALRYGSLALESSRSISEADARATTLNAVVRLASGLGSPGAALASRAIGMMPTARDQARARRDLAHEQLKGTPLEKAPVARLQAEARERLSTGDLSGGAVLVLALPDSPEREELLSAVLRAAIGRQDDEIALAAAQGAFDADRQRSALATLMRSFATRGVPLRSVELIVAMQDSASRAAGRFIVASELKRNGYGLMGGELLSAALEGMKVLDEAAQGALLPDAIGALVRFDRLDEALLQAGRLDAASDSSSALSELAVQLAERGRTVDAEGLLPRIADDTARSRVSSEIARASARAGDVAGALTTVSELGTPEAVAFDLAAVPDAADLIRTIADDRIRGRAFRRLAERRANHLTVSFDDDAGGRLQAAMASPAPEEAHLEVQTRRGLALIRTDAADPAEWSPVPSRFVTAAEVKADLPWPGGAVVGSTFAGHNPYIAKFLEDGEGGATRLEQAIRHQGLASPRIIVVQSGAATLGMVARELLGADARDLISYENDIVTLRAPIFVAPGASLILSGADARTYRMSADAGAFLANAGEVHIVDAEIIGYDEKTGQPAWSDNEKADRFRPFLLNWGDGRMNIASSVLAALGYDNAQSSGLTYSSGPDRVAGLRDQTRPTGIVVDNVFRNFYIGFRSQDSERVEIVGNEYRESIVHAVDIQSRSTESTIALNTAHGTMLRHGIAVSRDVEGSLIVGNLSFDNAGSGIVIDRGSANNRIHANSSFRNGLDGVTVLESSCNVLTNNHLAGNGRDGLKVRNSVDVGAYGNRIEANGSSGVAASIASIPAYAPVTGLDLRHNRFSSNRVGISTQGVSHLAMFSNHFVKQSRRLLGGDIRGLEGQVLRLASQSDMLIASTCRPVKPAAACRLRDLGLLGGSTELPVSNTQSSGSDCTDIDGSVQHRAFSHVSRGT